MACVKFNQFDQCLTESDYSTCVSQSHIKNIDCQEKLDLLVDTINYLNLKYFVLLVSLQLLRRCLGCCQLGRQPIRLIRLQVHHLQLRHLQLHGLPELETIYRNWL